MELTDRPYSRSPYDDVMEIEAPFMNKWRSITNTLIFDIQARINAEAAIDGNTLILDDEYFYDRFLMNREDGLLFGNWRLFKYFRHKFEIKVLKETIGEWSFTKSDVDMYRYYTSVEFEPDEKCKPRLLYFQCAEMPNQNLYYNQCTPSWLVYDINFHGKQETHSVRYYDFFIQHLSQCMKMTSHIYMKDHDIYPVCCGDVKLRTEDDMFSSKTQFNVICGDKIIDYRFMKNIRLGS